MKKNLTRKERLKSGKDFKKVFQKSKTFKSRKFKFLYMSNGLDYSRFGVTFRRNFGNAVVRNRQKRLSKEAYRNMKSSLLSGYDIVFLIYAPFKNFEEIVEKLDYVCKRAEIVK